LEIFMAKMFFAGAYADSESGETTEIRNPATGEVVDTVPKGTVGDVRKIVDVASEALGTWSRMAPAKRGALLQEAAHLVKQHEKELTALLTREQGKPIRESVLEIRRFVHTLEHYAGMAKCMRGGYVTLDDGRYALIMKKPIGVVGSIVPWNFPVSLMGNKVGPALLAGNTMVIKPAGTTPLTAIRCIELIQQAGLPKGAINVVTGPGSVVGEEILENPTIRKIGFTGATDTGKHIMEVASREIKRVTLELGGSDPMIVCDDADLDRAVSAASVGRFFNCGQACLAVKRLYLFDKIADTFVAKLIEKVKRLRIGNGIKPDTLLGPLHTKAQREEIEELVDDAVKRGAKIAYGGKRPEGGEYASGYFLLPTLLTDVDPDSRILTDECFGPALPIVRVKNLEEGISQANRSIYGLGSSVWTKDLDKAMRAAEHIDAGYTWVNSAQIIYDELPFGGVKQSGLGKEHGNEAIDFYTETKSIVIATEKVSEIVENRDLLSGSAAYLSGSL
jgi:succinate-semialdehyde dehydrogenase/glutarate-semialdehyde dehydrogenase